MRKITTGLTLVFILMAVIPAIFVSYYTTTKLSDRLHKEVTLRIENISQEKIKKWENFLNQEKKNIISDSLVIKNSFKHIFENSYNIKKNELKEIKKYLNKFRQSDSVYDVFVINSEGTIISTALEETDLGSNLITGEYKSSGLSRAYKKSVETGQIQISKYRTYGASGDAYSLFMALPIFDKNKVIGAYAIQLTNDQILETLSNYSGLGKTGEIMLFQKENDIIRVLSEQRNNDTFKQYSELNYNQAPYFVKKSLNGIRGSEIITFKGKERIATWDYIDENNWGFVIMINSDEVFQKESEDLKDIIIIISLIALLLMILGYILASLISDPINKLANQSKNINIEKTKMIGGYWHETRYLAQTFNKMMDEISNNISHFNKEKWINDGVGQLSEEINKGYDNDLLFDSVIQNIIQHTNALAGVIYSYENKDIIIKASHGLSTDKDNKTPEKHGLILRVLSEKAPLIIDESAHVTLSTAVQSHMTCSSIIYPLVHKGNIEAIIELIWPTSVHNDALLFLDKISEPLSLSLIANQQHKHLCATLKISQDQTEELKAQQSSLKEANDILEKKSKEILKAKEDTDKKSRELKEASRYKSEFLANMSHELRTPLNSMLILAKSLADNDDQNLSEEEIESCQVIYESGEHLLHLINDILDLSKVESGKMQLHTQEVDITQVCKTLSSRFNKMAEQNDSTFSYSIASLPNQPLVTDDVKLIQILTNLVGNAIKFTHNGKVELNIHFDHADQRIVFDVADTGIGIPEDKLDTIFGAFQQADGSTSRSYGGTGLGLSIVKHYSELMQGNVSVVSTPNVGSTFSLRFPLTMDNDNANEANMLVNKEAVVAPPMNPDIALLADDVNNLDASKPLILIIEDDPVYANILIKTCHKQGCQCLVATDGLTGIEYANDYPVQGILLDYMLPVIDGKDVLESLKFRTNTANIPVHVVTAFDNVHTSNVQSADGQHIKPVSLAELVDIIRDMIQSFSPKPVSADNTPPISHDTAIAVKERPIKAHGEEHTEKKKDTQSSAPSMVSATMFGGINMNEINADDCKPTTLLLVDDDMRNTFSLAKVMRKKGHTVYIAPSGQEALQNVQEKPDIECVLMDIMMPEMDGYETMRQIRAQREFESLAIIAVTANASPDDIQKCEQAGANAYIPKPVDLEALQKMIHITVAHSD